MNTNNKSQFCLGISKPLDIFNTDTRKLINFTLDKDLYVHTSLSYPINFFFIKYFLEKKKRHKIKFVCKILADNFENFKKTIDLTLDKYSIKKIHIIQLINLPTKEFELRNLNSLNINEFNKITEYIIELKKKEIIDKVYLQILSKDNLKFCEKLSEYFDGFAFYANLNEIHLKKDVFEFVLKKNLPSLILSIFGNPKADEYKDNLHTESYIFSQHYFTSNTIAVGRTLKLERLKEIFNTNQKLELYKNFNPKFIETSENQDTSENFFRRYNVTNIFYIIKFILKCLIKKIFSQKLIKLLKKYDKNRFNSKL